MRACEVGVRPAVYLLKPPSLFQVRQQLSEMKSHVEDGDVARSPAVSPEAPPAEQDPNKVRAVSPIPWVSATNSPTLTAGLCWATCHLPGRPGGGQPGLKKPQSRREGRRWRARPAS